MAANINGMGSFWVVKHRYSNMPYRRNVVQFGIDQIQNGGLEFSFPNSSQVTGFPSIIMTTPREIPKLRLQQLTQRNQNQMVVLAQQSWLPNTATRLDAVS